jgi:acyl-CoA synthetase (NDP forming)
MVSEGVEVIVGGKKDRDFGPVLMVGLGGVFTEIIDDVVFRLAPLSKEECLEMLKELKGYRIFTGFRGKNPSDLNTLADILMKFSNLLSDFPQISEADLNPVRVFEEGSGASVLDARIFLERFEGLSGKEEASVQRAIIDMEGL